MKLLIVLLTVFLSSNLLAQGFEGVIQMTTTIPMLGDQEVPVTVTVKGDRLKVETDVMGMGKVSMLVDKPAKRIVAILPGMNMATEIDMAELEKAITDTLISPPSPVAGQQTINNYQCTGYTCSLRNGSELEMWMTKDMPNTMHKALLGSFASSLQSMQISTVQFEQIMSQGYAPVRTIVRKNGVTQASFTLSSYAEQSVDDTAFAIPENIKMQKINPAMMQQQQQNQE